MPLNLGLGFLGTGGFPNPPEEEENNVDVRDLVTLPQRILSGEPGTDVTDLIKTFNQIMQGGGGGGGGTSPSSNPFFDLLQAQEQEAQGLERSAVEGVINSLLGRGAYDSMASRYGISPSDVETRLQNFYRPFEMGEGTQRVSGGLPVNPDEIGMLQRAGILANALRFSPERLAGARFASQAIPFFTHFLNQMLLQNQFLPQLLLSALLGMGGTGFQLEDFEQSGGGGFSLF